MRIDGVDAGQVTDELAGEVHAVLVAAQAVERPGDPPLLRATVATRLRTIGTVRPDRHRAGWVARNATGRAVGYAQLTLPLLDNRHAGFVELTVHPDTRRRGVGSTLLEVLHAAAGAAGRTSLFGEADEGGAGDPFCRARGFSMVQVDRISLLRFTDVDWPGVEQVPTAPGYRVERWTGDIPDEHLESYAAAKSAMNDAPLDDADLTDFTFTPDRIRADQASARSLGKAMIVAAVHEPTGTVAAFTELLVMAQSVRAHQNDTAVVPAHRGKGLGLRVKAEMLTWVRAEEPGVGEILTGNADSNRHMLRINDRLGFRPYSRILGFQGAVANNAVAAAR